MQFRNIDFDIKKEIPYTIWWLERIEELIRGKGYEIIIRDTDHRYNSLRIQVEINGRYDENSAQYENEIYAHIQNHCCKCGSTHNVKVNIDDSLFTMCMDCIKEQDKKYEE